MDSIFSSLMYFSPHFRWIPDKNILLDQIELEFDAYIFLFCFYQGSTLNNIYLVLTS